MLYFESLDADKKDRKVAPITVYGDDGYENTVNSFMDHKWDGPYTGQENL